MLLTKPLCYLGEHERQMALLFDDEFYEEEDEDADEHPFEGQEVQFSL